MRTRTVALAFAGLCVGAAVLALAWGLLRHVSAGQPVLTLAGTLLLVVLAAAAASIILILYSRLESSRHRALFVEHPAPLLMVDPSTNRITAVNASAAAVLGVPAGPVSGMPCADLDPALARLVAGARADGAARSVRSRPELPGVWMLSGHVPVDGRRMRVATLLCENTLPALLAADRRFRRAVEGSPHPTMVHADDGEIIALSDSWLEETGYRRADLRTTEDWIDRAFPGQAADARKTIARTYSYGARTDMGELGITCEDGTRQTWAFSAVALGHAPDGRRLAITVGFDVTGRRRTEEQLRESEALFRGLTEQSLVGVYQVQGDRLTYANPRFEEIFGYDTGEAAGKPISQFVSPRDMPTVQRLVRERLEGRLQEARYEFTGITKQGKEIIVGVHGKVTETGGERKILGVLQDITGRVRAEADIRDYLRQLEESLTHTVRTVSQLVEMRDPYTSGHELRVADLSAAIAQEMGLDENTQRGLRVAGALHDVGKIAVPSEILTKPGRLSTTEFALVKGHAAQGYAVLRNIAFPWPVAEVAHQHHERLDGSGYPQGLSGKAIVLEARITAVADVIEAMSSHRPYRPGHGVEAALDEVIRGRDRLFDADVVDACTRLFRERGYRMPDPRPGALPDVSGGDAA